MTNELKEAMKNGTAFDYVCENYYNMSKEGLKEAFCEYEYQVYCRFGKKVNKEIGRKTVEYIEENE